MRVASPLHPSAIHQRLVGWPRPVCQAPRWHCACLSQLPASCRTGCPKPWLMVTGRWVFFLFSFFLFLSFSFSSFFLPSLSFEMWWGWGWGNLDVEKNMTVTGWNCMPIYPRSSIKKSTTWNHFAVWQMCCFNTVLLHTLFGKEGSSRTGLWAWWCIGFYVFMFPERQRQLSLSGTNL